MMASKLATIQETVMSIIRNKGSTGAIACVKLLINEANYRQYPIAGNIAGVEMYHITPGQ